MDTVINRDTETIFSILKSVFGFEQFRPNQQEIVTAILEKHDVFAVMPTGGGKSLCYQLPALLLPGLTVVVSPLISLMKDQVDAANENGIAAAFINSSLKAREVSAVYNRLRNGDVKILYVAPERLTLQNFTETLGTLSISLFAIDEAHCISEWGHDFRPDYLMLSMLPERFSNVPIAAFTATATHRVQEDIITKIGLRSPFKIRASFDRPNLFYQVKKKNKVDRQIIEFLKERPHESGIVYRTTRDAVDDTAANLQNEGISSLPYHAGLVAEERRKCQEAFNKDEVQVIVATIAFGMGIDKSNVRFVIHADLPKNIEGYYQETGRSGRDGEPAVCLLLFGLGDIPKIRYFIDDITDSEQQAIARQKLNQMVAYGRHWVCRRKQLLAYFGETYDEENCKTCDVCVGDAKWIDITTDAQMVLSAVVRTGQRFGAMHISDIVVGGNTQRIRQWGHDKIKTYGVGKDKSRQHWRFVIEELVAQGILNQEDARYRVLTLNPSAAEVLKGNCVVKTIEMQDIENRKMMQPKEEMAYNETLFERLRQLRRRLAQEQQVPPFIIFSDRTLHEMCRYYPSTLSELGRISGVGEVKMDRYGDAFVNEIAEFLAENPDVQ